MFFDVNNMHFFYNELCVNQKNFLQEVVGLSTEHLHFAKKLINNRLCSQHSLHTGSSLLFEYNN